MCHKRRKSCSRSRIRQVRAHACRCASSGWHQRQSQAGPGRLVRWYRKYAPGERCRKSWRKQRERPRKACGPTRTPCRRGNGEKEAVRTSGKSLCYRRCCDRDYLDFELCLPPLPFHEILRHSQPDLSFWSSHKEITQKFALIVLLPLSAPMVRPTVTGFFVPVKSAPVPSTVNS